MNKTQLNKIEPVDKQIRHSEPLVEESTTIKEEMLRANARRKRFFSHFPFPFSFPRTAFTLAEVLITLGIIGVVASMTIPTLIQNYDKQQTVTGYRKMYSTLTNAIKQSEAENGEVDSWDWSFTPYDPAGTNLTWLNTYILPYLNVSKACNGTTNPDCFVQTLAAPGNFNLSFHPVSDTQFLKYRLSDGSSLAIIFRSSTEIEIIVDINGLKKPNTMGKDIFDFWLVNKKLISPWNISIKSGGIYPSGTGMNINGSMYSLRGCGKDVLDTNYAGNFCGMKIIQDGYQIKSDYPW